MGFKLLNPYGWREVIGGVRLLKPHGGAGGDDFDDAMDVIGHHNGCM